MHLKKLSLVGFKSFPQPTEVEFGGGMTGIVGPNGCGKTNILDALRWVLGEQRTSTLRSGKMEEVIFNGSRDAKPLGMSEVSLTIANSRGVLPTEYTDLTITRRLYRSGESEYLMNRQVCRLRDILDLFADTGMGAHSYSVIQQDMIEAVLSEKPEERRFLFDEAAGITKYKHRKKAALRKLDATEADLLRLRDIAAEVRTRVNSLKRQSNKARRYSELKEKWQDLHLRLARSDYEALHDRVRTQSTRAENLRADLEAARARVTACEAQRDAMRAEAEVAEQTVEAQRQRVAECDEQLHALNAKAEKARAENTAYATRQRELVGELDTLAARRRDRETRIDELGRELDLALQEAKVARQQAELRESARAEAETHWQSTRTDRATAQERADSAKALCRQLESEQVHLETSLVSLCEALAEAETAWHSAKTEARASDEAKVEFEAREEQARQKLQVAEAALTATRAERDEMVEAQEGVDEALNVAQTRLAELESQHSVLRSWIETYRGYQGAVPELLTRDRAAGLHDTVAEIVRPHRGFEVPLAAALAERAEYLVCRDRGTARLLMARLEASDAGRAHFIIMSALEANSGVAVPVEGARPLCELADVRDGFSPLKDFLLSGFYLWEGDAEPETDRLSQEAVLVTRSGRVYRGTSVTAAGRPAATSLLARKDELIQLSAQIEAQRKIVLQREREADTKAEALAAVQRRVAELEASVLEEQEAYRAQSLEAERARSRAQSGERDLERDLKLHESLVSRVDESRGRIAALKTKRQEADATYSEVQSEAQRLDTGFDYAEQARTEAILRSGEAQVNAVSLRGRVEGLENDRERTREMLLDVQNRIADLVNQLLDSGRKRRDATSALVGIADRRQALEQERGTREQEYLKTRGDTRDLLQRVHDVEQELKGARKTAEDFSSSHHDAEMAASEARLEVTALCDRVRETFNLELATCTELEAFEPNQRGLLTAEAQEMKLQLDAMGTVNLLALEEYDEQKERLDFLERQLEDMETAKKTLFETIQKINVTARGRFVETFDKVERNFNELFALLFQGGEARVSLDDPDNPLESPISVTARPRGKRPVSILQLSGGERALTAIALLFSLYMVKPSPFCILDEIDAPLDDANIGRFLSLLERFSSDTQFIIITHSKMTMQATDVLYGVTMQSPGISQVVSVRLDQALEVAEAG